MSKELDDGIIGALEAEVFISELQIGDDGFVVTWTNKANAPKDEGESGKVAEVAFIALSSELRKEAWLDINQKLRWLVTDFEEEQFSRING